MVRRLLIGGILLGLTSGCSGMSPAHLSQTVGAIAGSVVAPGVGAPLGALVGTLAGLVVQGQMDKATEKKERVELAEQLGRAKGSADPSQELRPPAAIPLGPPVRVWVDETMRDGRLVSGHFDVRPIP